MKYVYLSYADVGNYQYTVVTKTEEEAKEALLKEINAVLNGYGEHVTMEQLTDYYGVSTTRMEFGVVETF